MVLVPKIGSWIARNSGSHSDAKNILHEALTAMIISGAKKKSDPPENLEAYVFSICKYKWLDVLKQRKSTSEVTSDDQLRDIGGRSIEEEFIANERKALRYKIMERAFLHLSPICRQLIDLVKKGEKAAMIATKLKMSNQGTVNRRKFACMDSWRKFVKEDIDYNLLAHYD